MKNTVIEYQWNRGRLVASKVLVNHGRLGLFVEQSGAEPMRVTPQQAREILFTKKQVVEYVVKH